MTPWCRSKRSRGVGPEPLWNPLIMAGAADVVALPVAEGLVPGKFSTQPSVAGMGVGVHDGLNQDGLPESRLDLSSGVIDNQVRVDDSIVPHVKTLISEILQIQRPSRFAGHTREWVRIGQTEPIGFLGAQL